MEKQIEAQDGQTLRLIPGGDYVIGCETGYSEEKPVHTVTLRPFYLGEKPVTNAQFKAYCDAVKRPYPPSPRWPDLPDHFLSCPDHPVINVSYDEAAAYCAWAGGRLPTEEEWEAAAGGVAPSDGAAAVHADYPWGNEPVASRLGVRANFADKNSDLPWEDHGADDGCKYTAPAGHYPPNGFGLYDMAGNVFEWVQGWFYRYDDYVRDTAALGDGWGGSRVTRGGCWHSPASDLRVSRRRQVLGGSGNASTGFRVARDAETVQAKPETVRADATGAENVRNKPAQAGTASPKLPDGVELCCGSGFLGDAGAKRIKDLGFTSVENYLTWETIENAGNDKWDFSAWDRQYDTLRRAGLKWLPFLIAGPAYSLPDWYRASEDFHGIVCLEHDIESKIQTPWNPRFHGYVERFLRAVSEHYADKSGFEAILLGICGDFGEAIMSVWHGYWPLNIPGIYHAHAGYWCADRYARADFSAKMAQKYSGSLDALNAAWGTSYPSLSAVTFPPFESGAEDYRVDECTSAGVWRASDLPSRRRKMDFIDWYRSSMTDYVAFWMETARRYFPDTEIYLCTGGDAVPWHASEFAAQCKAAAAINSPRARGGVRITNEASNYAFNFALTGWVASASRLYGGCFSFEPAGQVTERGVVARVYNAAAAGAKSLHYYEGNLGDSPERIESFRRNVGYLGEGGVERELGLLYPDTPLALEPERYGRYYDLFCGLRDFSDYEYASDLTIADGALDSLRALVIPMGGCYRKATLDRICAYAAAGHPVIGLGLTELYALEDGEDYLPKLTDGKNAVNLSLPEAFKVSDAAAPLREALLSRGVPVPDGEIDGVFAAKKHGRLLIMNYSGHDVTRTFRADGRDVGISLHDAEIRLI